VIDSFPRTYRKIFSITGASIWYQQSKTDFEPASVDRMAYPVTDKPPIAVLPFGNMSRNSDQEFLNDGFTEQIITNLSMLPKKKIVLVLVVYSAPSLFNESILD